jgi:hypothetical protein
VKRVALVIPEHVLRLAPEEQVEWFAAHDVGAQPHSTWDKYHVSSLQHRGLCCPSCIEEGDEGEPPFVDDCCCEGWLERNFDDAP